MTPQEQEFIRQFENKVREYIGDRDIQLVLAYTDNGFVIRNAKGGRAIQSLTEAFNKAFQFSKENAEDVKYDLAAIGISTSYSVEEYLNPNLKTLIGRIADQKGRYFEYCVFTGLEKKLIEAGGTAIQDKDYSKMQNQGGYKTKIVSAIQILSAAGEKEYDNLDIVIESVADKAVESLTKDLTASQIRSMILQALAQSNKTGDIKFGNTILELKFSSSKFNIKYFTLSDVKNFGRGLLPWVKQYKGELWADEPGEKVAPPVPWANSIATVGFYNYATQYLAEQAGDADGALFNYLLQKGNVKPKINKKVVLGLQGTAENPIINIDADAFIQDYQQEIKSSGSESDSKLHFTHPTLGNVGYLQTELKSIARWSRDKVEKAPNNGESASTTFLFYLQGGFFSS